MSRVLGSTRRACVTGEVCPTGGTNREVFPLNRCNVRITQDILDSQVQRVDVDEFKIRVQNVRESKVQQREWNCILWTSPTFKL